MTREKKKKENVWLDIKRHQGDFLEIILRDATRAKIISWMINVNDKKRARQIMKSLKIDYGVDFGLDFKKERDIDWLP